MSHKKYDRLIIGSGLFAVVFAQKAKEKRKKCIIVEKRSRLGGNIYCEKGRR